MHNNPVEGDILVKTNDFDAIPSPLLVIKASNDKMTIDAVALDDEVLTHLSAAADPPPGYRLATASERARHAREFKDLAKKHNVRFK